jgi:hypothetical protein
LDAAEKTGDETEEYFSWVLAADDFDGDRSIDLAIGAFLHDVVIVTQ